MVEELQSGDFVTPTVKLIRPLAQGGMGTVWIAEHLTLDTQVVVKLMTVGVELAEGAASRFAREAAIAAAVKSPHVVQVFDSGTTANGIAFIVMELLDGRDLGAHLQARGKLPPLEVAGILTQLGKALSKAHRVGVIHRDIKPDNVFLCDVEGDEKFVKLLDFGTAKDGGNAPYSTTLGQLIGTPYYMSPEQILGEAIDHRTDIWSLGVVVYEALTGARPFDGATVGAVTLAIHTMEPRPSSLVNDLPLTIDEWFAKCCARDPADRYQTARAATHAFAQAAIGDSPLGEESPESSYDGIPHSSRTVMPADSASSARSLVSTTTTLSETLHSTRKRERRTMMWIAGFVAAAALAAMVALVTSDGSDRSTKTAAAPEAPTAAPSPSASASPEPTATHSHAAATATAPTITAPTTTVVTEAPAMTVQRPAITTAMPPVRRTVPTASAAPSATPSATATASGDLPAAPLTATEAPSIPPPDLKDLPPVPTADGQ